ncbi:MAG: 4-alpha-glucanotransferase [Lachnospiraceae bacterium]|nr:4-alpha-glucanotransferase [Lachnospiraceae bacterium]
MSDHRLGKRACGVLLPVFSLPSPYGIGAFSKEAYDFVDFLADAGQSYWQILPLGPTAYGNSPYQSYSTYAGNPLFIDIETLIEDGLLPDRRAAARAHAAIDGARIDYDRLLAARMRVLRKAYENSGLAGGKRRAAFVREYEAFCKRNASWLEDYALFMALKDANGGRAWTEWEDRALRLRERGALSRARKTYAHDTGFYRFVQFLFARQWQALKAYANGKGIDIIGDLPIYVAPDSADTWANPALFELDGNRKPKRVAGCPPDDYAVTGQLWGNPVYRWEKHAKDNYRWWVKRLTYALAQTDVLRIDHFRGFESYYAIDAHEKTAENGVWEKGPDIALFRALEKKKPGCRVIAEDLGFLTPAVHRLMKKTGYPGMKVLQFAFYPDGDGRFASDYLPYQYERNCVVYTGTHDNDTTVGWYRTLGNRERAFLRAYLDVDRDDAKRVTDALIRAALSSVADTAIIPLQDYLKLDTRARVNTPSTVGENWKWRMRDGQMTDALAKRMRALAVLYGRI